VRESSAAVVELAKTPGVRTGTPKRQNVHFILPFEQFLRTIWPADRTKNYMRLTGAKMRTAKRRLAGDGSPDYAELVAVLRSEHGFALLQHVMGDHRPQWWSGVSRAKHLGDLRKQVAEQQRKIAQLEMSIE
jgi:hypothetical protein